MTGILTIKYKLVWYQEIIVEYKKNTNVPIFYYMFVRGNILSINIPTIRFDEIVMPWK